MKKLILAVGLSFALVAAAGEKWLGNTYATDAGSANNQWTSPPFNTFVVPAGSKLTVQCDQASLVMTDVPMVDAGTAIALTAGQSITTSCTSLSGKSYALQDAGQYSQCLVSSQAASGEASLCKWFSRLGNEGI